MEWQAKPTKFDPNRPVALIKLVIHNSMSKSAIDQSYLVSYIIFLYLPTYEVIRKVTFTSEGLPDIKNIRLQVREVDLHFEDSKRFNTEQCSEKS